MNVIEPFRDEIMISFLTATLIAATWPILAQDVAANDNPSLHVERASGEIKIDGRLDDPGWKGVEVADNYCETSPGDNIRPPVDTRAYMTFDDDNLYVAIVASDNPC